MKVDIAEFDTHYSSVNDDKMDFAHGFSAALKSYYMTPWYKRMVGAPIGRVFIDHVLRQSLVEYNSGKSK